MTFSVLLVEYYSSHTGCFDLVLGEAVCGWVQRGGEVTLHLLD